MSSPAETRLKISMLMTTESREQVQDLAFSAIVIQEGRAKLTASATLKPELNPE